jgi:enterochelin esterase-like enzyme
MEPDCTRRQVLAAAVGVGLAVQRAAHPSERRSSGGSFQIRHAGRSVRCLYRASAATSVPPLVVVLLHGASADASQWIDIGLATAVDVAAAGHPTQLVAVAPDVDGAGASQLVLESLLPAVSSRFRPHGAFAISGISRGAGQALQTALQVPRRFSSIGLHSPAVGQSFNASMITVPVFIDAGADDALAAAARRLADELVVGHVPVTTSWPTGGHDRPYWRAHLSEYLAFHLLSHETTT